MELYYLYYPNTLISLGSSVVFRHQHLRLHQVQQQMQSQISDLRDKLTDASAERWAAIFRCQWTVQLADACCVRYTEIANMKKTKSQFEQEAGVAPAMDPKWGFQKVQGELIQGEHDFRSMQSASPCRNNCSEPGLLLWHEILCLFKSLHPTVDIPNMSQPWANRAALLSRWLKDCLEISHPTACHGADGSSCSWCWSHRTWRRNLFDLGEVTWLRYSLLHPCQFFPSFGH